MRLDFLMLYRYFWILLIIGVPVIAFGQTDFDTEIAKNKAQLQEIIEQIDRIKHQIKASQDKETSLSEQIALIDREVALLSRKKGLLERESRLLQKKIAVNNIRLQETRERYQQLKNLYAQRAIYTYKYGRLRNLELLLTAESFNQALVRYKYLNRIAEQDERNLQLIEEKKREIQQLQNQLAADLDQKRLTLRQKEDEQMRYLSRKKQKESLLKELRWNTSLYQERLSKKQRKKEELDNIIIALERKRRYQEQTGRIDEDYVQFDFDDFTKTRGKLPWPVKGKIISKYGKVRDPLSKTFIKNTDIEIQSPLGTPVKSVFSGVVRMITYLPSYGNTIIIDHGKGYYTVYSHLDEIYVRKNDITKTGQVVATVGDSGSLSGSKLQFGIYGGNKTYNPIAWLSK
ncbi:MAG: peptidoglycan DD-metalloendopeptidase family protein [Caldithrix sp.]|nr:peptidoglycan DD-metalloendopeptidase family protein [Caldithrix sp.]